MGYALVEEFEPGESKSLVPLSLEDINSNFKCSSLSWLGNNYRELPESFGLASRINKPLDATNYEYGANGESLNLFLERS
jgi:hypothetical protein